MTREEMLQDINYARALAEEGRQAPLIGGGYFVMFGVLLAICYVVQWGVLAGLLPFQPNFIGVVWAGFGLAALIGGALLSARIRKLPGGAAIPNRVDRHVWQGVMAAILVVVAGTVTRAALVGDFSAPNAIVASGFGFYGVALYATATAGGHAWLRNFAIQAWILSGMIWFFLDKSWIYLLAAGGCIAVLAVPGLVMMRREPKVIV